jgi:hypothetical protein
MELLYICLGLIGLLLIVNLIVSFMVSSVIARSIESQQMLRDSIQVISEQLSDIEENQNASETEIRKIIYVLKANGTDKPWYMSF